MKSLLASLMLCLAFSGYSYAQGTSALHEKCIESAGKYLETHSSEGVVGQVIHYNNKLLRCFIRIDYFFFVLGGSAVGLVDAFEGESIGSFFQIKDEILVNCYVGRNVCSSRAEFEALIKSYMEE